jgi:hypothetical protein
LYAGEFPLLPCLIDLLVLGEANADAFVAPHLLRLSEGQAIWI